MPANMDFELYFNLAFFSILGFGLIFGFFKGFKKALWGLLVTTIFIVFFFLTIDQVVNVLWTLNMPFLGGLLTNIDDTLSSVSTLSEALPIVLEKFIKGEYAVAVSNEHFLEFTTAIALFVLKVAYTIIYFTIIQILYRLILFIFKAIFTPKKKKTDKYKSKNRGLGALIGLLQGGLSLYITIIIFSGIMSIGQSVANIIPEEQPSNLAHIDYRYELNNPTSSVIEMAAFALPDIGGLEEATELLNNMIGAYNTNPVINVSNQLTMTSPYNSEEQMPLSLYLFDSVLSMNYQGEQIAIREEISIFSNVAADVMASDFMKSDGNLNEIKGDDIRSVFISLSESNIINSVLPLGIEVAYEIYDSELELELDDLYDIDWETEMGQLGEIAAIAFDIVNAAGALDGEVDLTTVTIDGTEVSALFTELGESQLVSLAAFVAINPLLAEQSDTIKALVTVPEGLNWSDEFEAIGALAGSVLNAGLTVNDVVSKDINNILTVLSNIDFTILLDSQLITNAIINILSGSVPNVTVPEAIKIPADIQWLNTEVGGEVVYGELYNILSAISALAASASNIDFNDLSNISIKTISEFTAEDINALFNSKILVATITNFLKTQELSESFELIMPDSVFDEDGYILKLELQNVVNAVLMLVTDLACPIDKEACQEIGIDMDLIFTLDEDNIDILLASQVLSASAGNMIISLGENDLTIPGSAISSILVNEVSKDVVSSEEIKNAFLAISSLGITNINNLNVDASILNNLAVDGQPTVLDMEKANTLFGSSILNATLSGYLIDYTTGENSLVVVPYYAEDNITEIRQLDSDGVTEYISQTELTNILKAVLVLDIEDFNAVDTIDISTIIANVSTLLDSSILHATVSKQLLDLTDVVVVPEKDELDNFIKITVGTDSKETLYIAKQELENAFDALSVLGINDINNVAIDITILNNLAVDGEPTVLDTTKSDTLFSSAIINATLAKYLLDFTEGETQFIVVPWQDQEGATIRTVADDGTQFISQTELTNVLKAVLVLDIQDFNAVDEINITTILTNISTLLDSAILHATVSKQMLDLTDVVVVPSVNELGDPVKVSIGPDLEKETTFIVDTELENAFDALSVLNIQDINNISMDMTILNNLAEEGNPTALDSAKATRLFSSAIINATLSKFIIDFTDSPDPFLVVPYEAQDGTTIRIVNADLTEVITEAELTNILEAILILDLEDFNSVETLGLETILTNVSTILDSSIMHASISKQFIDLGSDIVVIPSYHMDDSPLIITRGTINYIDRLELEATFDALDVLGLNDIANMSVDVTILNNLGTEAEPTILDDTKAATLFSSTILKATISKYILDFSEGESAILTVPQKDEADQYIKVTSAMDSTNYITQVELTNVLGAILALNLQDFNQVDGLGLNTIITNKTTILASTILQATISDQIIDLGTGIILVPETQENYTTEVLITRGDPGFESTYITNSELGYLLDALEVLGLSDINSFNGGFDLTLLDQPGTIPTLVQSTIIQATISKQVFDLVGDESATTLVIVPYETPNGSTDIRRTVGVIEPLEIIIKSELENLIQAFVTLGFTDVNNMGDAITISTLSDNASTIFESYIIQATVSKQVVDLESATIVVPYWTDNLSSPSRVRLTSGDPLVLETEFIEKNELIALMNALDVLVPEGSGVDGFAGDINVSLFYELANRTILLNSYILQATISKQIIDLGSTAIEVPYYKDDTTTVVRLTAGAGLEATDYLVDDEIHALFEALEVLEMDAIGDFDGETLSFNKFMPSYGAGYDNNQTILLASACIQATVSTQIIDLGSAITVPTHDDTDSIIKVTLISGTDYIVVSEIKHLLNALDVLGFSITDFNGTIGLTALFESSTPLLYDTNQNTLLTSAIMHATFSKQIEDLDGSAIMIPEANRLGTYTHITQSGNEFITKLEIKALLNGMDKLGFSGNLSGFSGGINLNNISSSGDQDILLLSAILHATISDQIKTLGQTAFTLPSTDVSGTTVYLTTVDGDYFVEKTEIKALLDAMNVLEISGDLSGFSGSIGLSNLFKSSNPINYSTNQTTVLTSAIMHATITDQIKDMDGSALVVPSLDIDANGVDITQTGNYYIYTAQIKYFLDALDVLGVGGNLADFDGTIDLSKLADDTSQNTLLLSAIMHATLSDKLINTTLVIPDQDINRAETIRVTQATVEFIEKIEMKALLVSLDALGLTNYNSMGMNISVIFTTDLNVLFASATLQATVSKEILPTASTYSAATPGNFIVPMDLREDITVLTVADKWIERSELINIINAFDEMGLSGFGVTISGTSLSSYNQTQIHTILLSGSMHLTIEKMIKDNANINSYIPDITGDAVIHDSLYSIAGIITTTEVENFILAINVLGGDISGDITAAGLTGLTETDRNTVLTSAIARCKLTADLVTLYFANHGLVYGPSDYETLDTAGNACLTYLAALEAF